MQQPLSWPLTVGAVSSYAVKSGTGAADPWQCAVEQREKVSVAAGTFDTYKIPLPSGGRRRGRRTIAHLVLRTGPAPLCPLCRRRRRSPERRQRHTLPRPRRNISRRRRLALGSADRLRLGGSHTSGVRGRWRAHPLGKHRHRRPLHHRPRPRGRQRQLAPLPPPVTGKNRKRRHDPPLPRRRLPARGRAVADPSAWTAIPCRSWRWRGLETLLRRKSSARLERYSDSLTCPLSPGAIAQRSSPSGRGMQHPRPADVAG